MRTWHMTFVDALRSTFFPGEHALLTALRALSRVAGRRTVMFSVVDDHIHLLLMASEGEHRRLGRACLLAFRSISQVPIQPPHVRPVEGRAHMTNLVKYLLLQPRKHGLAVHPALWSGSCFTDLVGGRLLPGLELCILDAHPRFRRRDATDALDLPWSSCQPAQPELLYQWGATSLYRAALAALALPPDQSGKGRLLTRARRAAIHLGRGVGLTNQQLAHATKLPLRSVQRHWHSPPEPELIRAASVRLSLLDYLTTRGYATPASR